jgi:hypothetical protein
MAMLVVFIVGVGISSIFFTAELALLDRSYTEQTRLRISAVLKTIWFIISLGLVIAFAVLSFNRNEDSAAGCEWTVCFFYGFYLLVLAYDLAPAAKTSSGQLLEKKVSYTLTRALSWIPGLDESRDEALINQNALRETSPVGEAVYKHRELHGFDEPEYPREHNYSYRGQDFDALHGSHFVSSSLHQPTPEWTPGNTVQNTDSDTPC